METVKVGVLWLHADSHVCHVCAPALKCHLQGRDDGQEGGSRRERGVAAPATPDTRILILYGLHVHFTQTYIPRCVYTHTRMLLESSFGACCFLNKCKA